MRYHLRSDLLGKSGNDTWNDFIKTEGAVGKTVCTVVDRGNVVLFYRLQDEESDFSSLHLFHFLFQVRHM